VIRAVVDTSIRVRALLKPQGTVGPLLTRLRRGDYVLLYSEALLAELVDVLDRPRIRDRHHIAADDVRAVLTLLWLRGEPVRLTRTITACRDPQDDKVLEIAVAGKADAIVTGDEDLLALHPFEGIPIVGPAEFLSMLPPLP
jgi:putative PIN family toxin of toxin-antitoxin system